MTDESPVASVKRLQLDGRHEEKIRQQKPERLNLERLKPEKQKLETLPGKGFAVPKEAAGGAIVGKVGGPHYASRSLT